MQLLIVKQSALQLYCVICMDINARNLRIDLCISGCVWQLERRETSSFSGAARHTSGIRNVSKGRERGSERSSSDPNCLQMAVEARGTYRVGGYTGFSHDIGVFYAITARISRYISGRVALYQTSPTQNILINLSHSFPWNSIECMHAGLNSTGKGKQCWNTSFVTKYSCWENVLLKT